jgi:hypothetical protein
MTSKPGWETEDNYFYVSATKVCSFYTQTTKTKELKTVALVRERTIPTERPPLVGEVSANFLRIDSVAWSVQRIPTVVNLGFLDRSRNFFPFKVAPQLS